MEDYKAVAKPELRTQMCTLISRYLDWLILKSDKNYKDYDLIKLCILNPSKLGFPLHKHSDLRMSMKKLMTKLPEKFKLNLFESTLNLTLYNLKLILEDMDTNNVDFNPHELKEKLEGLTYLKPFCLKNSKIPAVQRLENIDLICQNLLKPTGSSFWKDSSPIILDLILSTKTMKETLDMLKKCPKLLKEFQNIIFAKLATYNSQDEEDGAVLNEIIPIPVIVKLAKFCTTLKNAQDLKPLVSVTIQFTTINYAAFDGTLKLLYSKQVHQTLFVHYLE